MSRLFLPLIATLLLAGAAHAANVQCTAADKSAWLPAAQVQKMLQQHGFTGIGAVQAGAGNCYVVQATDQSGSKKTLYLDPTDGALVALE